MFENALWFFSGALLYRALSIMLGISVYKRVVQECYDYLLLLCDAISVDFQNALNRKRDCIEQSDMEETKKKQIYKSDNSFKTKWQTTIISKLIISIPNRHFNIKKHLINLDPNDRLKELKDNLDKLNR